MHSVRLTQAAAALLACTFVSAQTTTLCDPTLKDCPPDPAFGGDSSYDFTTSDSVDGLEKFWTLDGGVKFNQKLITFDKGTGANFHIIEDPNAPLIWTTQYIFFGKVEVVMQAAPGQGVVTSVVLQSDDRDEIDWEIIGSRPNFVETNFYSKGVNDYTHSKKIDAGFDTTAGLHTYTIEWTNSFITFSIDGRVVRTATPAEAGNGASYPQTPCQLRLGIWPGGCKTCAEGTTEWAGGRVDYSKAPFTAMYKSVKITDYMGGYKGAKEYVWSDRSGSWQSIQVVGGGEKGDLPGASGASTATVAPTVSSEASSKASAASSTLKSDTIPTLPANASTSIVTSATRTSGTGGGASPTGTQPIPPNAGAKNVVSLAGVGAFLFAILLL